MKKHQQREGESIGMYTEGEGKKGGTDECVVGQRNPLVGSSRICFNSASLGCFFVVLGYATLPYHYNAWVGGPFHLFRITLVVPVEYHPLSFGMGRRHWMC